MSELRVESNTPRLLERGEAPPAATPDEQLPPDVPVRYWTPDKAQHVVARLCHAGSKFYGPSVKAAEWELELIGEPAAAVLNDFMPLRVGASGDRTANLIALGAVIAILVVLRLPDILEVHGVEFPWAKRQRQLSGAAEQPREEPAAPARREEQRPQLSVVDNPTQTAFAEQLVGESGAGAAAGAGEKTRDAVYGAQHVGGGSFAAMHESGDQPA